MKAANRAREKVAPEFYDPNTFYDPFNENADSQYGLWPNPLSYHLNSSDDDFPEGRDRRGEIRAERNIHPTMRKIIDWSEQNKQYISEQTKSVCLPYYSDQDITYRAKQRGKNNILTKKVGYYSELNFNTQVNNSDLILIGKGKSLGLPFNCPETFTKRVVATPEVLDAVYAFCSRSRDTQPRYSDF